MELEITKDDIAGVMEYLNTFKQSHIDLYPNDIDYENYLYQLSKKCENGFMKSIVDKTFEKELNLIKGK